MLQIDTLPLGDYQTNCYIVRPEGAKECLVIDPGYEPEIILSFLKEKGLELSVIALTHGHFDHTSAVRPLLEQYPDVPVYIHEKDAVDTERGELLFHKVGPENQRYYKEDPSTIPTPMPIATG